MMVFNGCRRCLHGGRLSGMSMTSADWPGTATASQTKEGTREERKQRTLAFTCFVRPFLNASHENKRRAALCI